MSVKDAGGKPAVDAAVFALSTSASAPAKLRSATIEQSDREFVPYVTIVQTGTSVTFPNRDPILHHVYSFSPAKTFEIKLYTGKSPGGIVFDKAGVVTLGCNIHDWMIGYVVVVDTPFFARTDAQGLARLRDVPRGAYELRVWHPQQRAVPPAQQLTVESVVEAGFTLDIAPRKAKYKPPLDRMKY